MSEFDEEAERERLREQFERDREKRKTTERMSELLLQGATMTDQHCGTCGDPIFRYEGQEFCATCQSVVNSDSDDTGMDAASETSDELQEIREEKRQTESDDDSTADEIPPDERHFDTVEGQESPANSTETRDDSTESAEKTARVPANTSRDFEPDDGSVSESSSTEDTFDQHIDVPGLAPGARRADENDRNIETDLTDARESLVSTLRTFARQAESTDNPTRARESLRTARESAEALAALDRIY